MKFNLIPLRFNELLCWSDMLPRPERLLIFTCRVITEIQGHMLSRWIDSTRIALQAASGLSLQLVNHTTGARRESIMSH
jgi:hypothetical protein